MRRASGFSPRMAATTHRPATTEIEQPPLNERACLEVSVQAVLPNESPARFEPIEARPACGCAECARAHGLRIHVGDEVRFHAAALCGPGETAYEQTLGMFGLAEDLLQQAGMEFRDVVRTWIHMRDIDRDYADLNRARREFFAARGIDPVPASTGIGGGPVPEGHDLCLGVYAVKAGRPLVRTVMTSPTLNEAAQYGADFVRGMKVVETNKVALHVSGTASIDEHGRTAHVGDFEAQADRMLVNIAALLEGQGAGLRRRGFRDHVPEASRGRAAPSGEAPRRRLRGLPPRAGRGADLPARPAVRNGGAGRRCTRSVGALKRLADQVLQLPFAKVRHRPAIDEVLRCRRDFQRHCIVAVLLHALRDFGCIHVGHQLFDIQPDACNRRPYQLRSSGVIRRPLGLRGQQRLQGLPVLACLRLASRILTT